MTKTKKTYRKSMLLFNKTTKEKIIFLKWQNKDTASCITQKDKRFLNLSKTKIDNEYESYSALEKQARERSKGQCWRGL